jgi:hypothetical protein
MGLETYSLAFMNAVLFVFMTSIFSEAGVLKNPWEMAGALFLGCLFFVSAYYNSVNGVSEGKDKTAERGCAIFPGKAPVLLRQAESGRSGYRGALKRRGLLPDLKAGDFVGAPASGRLGQCTKSLRDSRCADGARCEGNHLRI